MDKYESESHVDVSVVVTFHNEGVLAHTALTSICQSSLRAIAAGVRVEVILVLDRADSLTVSSVLNHPKMGGGEVLLHVSNGDLALSRHSGIDVARGEFICIVDGDDLISRDYVLRHFLESQKHGENVALHPEIVVSFGMYNAFSWQVDQGGEYFDKPSLLVVNPWISAVFARKTLFESIPQVEINTVKTGFGFEDWCWNCETIAAGIEHRLAWGTVYMYRRKFSGSMNENSRIAKAIVPPNSLFKSSLLDLKRTEQ
ncbi:glycosyltransferase family A protein [Luteimonas sp. FXH3W]|uniref:Glycosyltransferase family A protein n=1 Tax=Aquilutibacter rugosus TaxID=3115820 RepID=A0ABU7UXH7_9GAMM